MSTPLELYVARSGAPSGLGSLWRVLLGVLVILVGWFLWTVVVMIAFVIYQIASGVPVNVALESLGRLVGAAGPVGVLFQLATFAGIWPATWAALRLLHAQPFGTLFSPERRIRWRDFGGGLLLAAAFSALTIAVALVAVGMPARTELSAGAWLAALAPLAVLVFLQASGEELIFRGYLLQQLAARFRTPVIWAAVPAILFGFAHYSGGTQLGIGWHYVVVTALFGITAAALVWRTGSLAAAMGLHTGMNLLAIGGMGVEGVLEGTQLFVYGRDSAALLFSIDGVATALILAFVLSPLCPFGPREVPAQEPVEEAG